MVVPNLENYKSFLAIKEVHVLKMNKECSQCARTQ